MHSPASSNSHRRNPSLLNLPVNATFSFITARDQTHKRAGNMTSYSEPEAFSEKGVSIVCVALQEIPRSNVFTALKLINV